LKKGEAMKRNDIDIYENDSYNNLMNNKIDKKTMKKNEIIRKSIHVIFEKGYNGTGVKDLTDAAGIPKGSLYNYFENKEDYLKEALNLYYNEMSQKQFSILSDKNLNVAHCIQTLFFVWCCQFFNQTRNFFVF
jgi:TetR/AcrR family transcriptional regulator, transcriptional repressor for nem operon